MIKDWNSNLVVVIRFFFKLREHTNILTLRLLDLNCLGADSGNKLKLNLSTVFQMAANFMEYSKGDEYGTF